VNERAVCGCGGVMSGEGCGRIDHQPASEWAAAPPPTTLVLKHVCAHTTRKHMMRALSAASEATSLQALVLVRTYTCTVHGRVPVVHRRRQVVSRGIGPLFFPLSLSPLCLMPAHRLMWSVLANLATPLASYAIDSAILQY
jgi:hypothetical protein